MVVITRSRACRTRSGTLVSPLLTLETAPALVARRRSRVVRLRRTLAVKRLAASRSGDTRTYLYDLMGDEDVLRETHPHLFAGEEEPAEGESEEEPAL